MSLIDNAKYYSSEFGFNITVSLFERTVYNQGMDLYKHPAHDTTNFDKQRQDKDFLNRFNWTQVSAIGATLGYENLRALDIDDCDDISLARDILTTLGLNRRYKWLVKTGTGFHIIVRCEKLPIEKVVLGSNKKYKNKFRKIEFRWRNFIVLPPTKHRNGKYYSFINGEPKRLPEVISVQDAINVMDIYCNHVSSKLKRTIFLEDNIQGKYSSSEEEFSSSEVEYSSSEEDCSSSEVEYSSSEEEFSSSEVEYSSSEEEFSSSEVEYSSSEEEFSSSEVEYSSSEEDCSSSEVEYSSSEEDCSSSEVEYSSSEEEFSSSEVEYSSSEEEFSSSEVEYNSSEIAYLTQRISSLWHMTHIDNLDNILRYGILSHTVAHDRFEPEDISNRGVQVWREKREPVYHRRLHDYSPTYISIRNPMLYNKKEVAEQLCLLEISTSIVEQAEFLFTDGNAASKHTNFYNKLVDLEQLPWDVINADYWTVFEDGKRKKCAEFLFYPKIDVRYIKKIHCFNHTTRRIAEKCVKKTVNVCISPDLFFRES